MTTTRTHLASLLVLVALAGCGGDKSTKPIVPSDGLPAGTPAADTPAHLAARLEKTVEFEVEAEYAKLLTADFRYVFSLASDPKLVDRYPNWSRTDELAAITHLFDGFTNTSDYVVPGANRIDLTLTGVQYGVDLNHADSTVQYARIVITALDGTIEVPSTPEPVVYSISARHELLVVRGDAAVLPAGTVADSTRWYVRRWDDLSTNTASRKGPVIHPAQANSFGSIRSLYR